MGISARYFECTKILKSVASQRRDRYRGKEIATHLFDLSVLHRKMLRNVNSILHHISHFSLLTILRLFVVRHSIISSITGYRQQILTESFFNILLSTSLSLPPPPTSSLRLILLTSYTSSSFDIVTVATLLGRK